MIKKATLRIPTNEQYAYIELEVEGTDVEIVAKYQEVTNMVQHRDGLQPKEWRKAIDIYIDTGEMESDEYANMSPYQKMIIQEIKRSINRHK